MRTTASAWSTCYSEVACLWKREGSLMITVSQPLLNDFQATSRDGVLIHSRSAEPVYYRVALFIRVPRRITSIDRPVNRRTSRDESRANARIRVARSPMQGFKSG